eukprot:scaffold153_cov347-Pavlova_lutheri.AAC.64
MKDRIRKGWKRGVRVGASVHSNGVNPGDPVGRPWEGGGIEKEKKGPRKGEVGALAEIRTQDLPLTKRVL